MTTIYLKPNKEESILRQHPWVFSGAIERIALDKDYPFNEPQEGELVCVYSHQKEILAVGHWQIGSIAVRILAFGTDTLPDNFWQEKIKAAYDARKAVGLITPQNNTYRLIHGEGDFLPGLIVDVYASTAVIQSHSIGMHKARHTIANTIVEIVPEVHNIYYKSDDTLPHKALIEGQKTGWLIAQNIDSVQEFWSRENGLDFRIDWLNGQKTGFFIDQRENRALVERYAKGKDVLNMFCYTGGFSLYAIRGGAKQVDSVDISQKAIDLVNINVNKNFPNCNIHNAVTKDAFDYLADMHQKGQSYDLIILDPPAFAKHREALKNALRGYQRINEKAIRMIKPGGILFTFSCSQAVDKDMFRRAVFSAAVQTGRKVRILHQLHQPQDHPINIYHPEGEYLKGLVLFVE